MGSHFSADATKFLRNLKRNNDREWFAKRKSVYDRELREPMLALIGEVNEAMLSFAPEHVRPPQKSIMRIYRDVRFSKDKQPYKTHVAAWWAREGMPKTTGGGFYFDLGETEITIAGGVFMPDKNQLLAIRRFLIPHHDELDRLLSPKRLHGLMEPIGGLPLIRPPKGFANESQPALRLIQSRRWGIAATLPVSQATSSDLSSVIIRCFKLAAPIVQLLNQPLASASKRPLFS